MPNPPISDERLREIVDACKGHSSADAAPILGISASTIRHHLRTAAQRGLMGFKPVLTGFEISQISTAADEAGNITKTYVTQRPERTGEPFAIPPGHIVKGASALLDADNRVIQQWIKTREGLEPRDAAEILKTAFADYSRPALPAPISPTEFEDALTLYPISDLHMGLYSWASETDKNWDLKTSEEVFGAAIKKLVAMSIPTNRAVILGGGDALHADNKMNRTLQSGNALDVDGRYDKVLLSTCFLFVYFVDLALQQHEFVDVRVLKGNHDEHSSVAISYFLLAHYRNESRVKVDISASLFWFYLFGTTFLSATHGHAAKLSKMPMIMAVDRPDYWAASKHRFSHGFHVHHAEKNMDDIMGVITEAHQAPCPRGAWDHGEGFRSGNSMCSIIYDRENGETGRARVAL